MAWTFTTLKQSIQDYTNNTETTFVNNLDEFILEAEEAILKLVDLPYFRKNVTGQLTSSNQYLTMPTDFLAPYSLAIDDSGYEYLLFKDVTFMRESYPSSSTTGTPKYYSIFDNETFIVAPTPSSNLTVELHYRYKPTSITTSSDGTTWLGTNASDCLLYGSLVEAYTFMKGEADVLNNYKERFSLAIERLKVLGEGRDTKDNYRSGSLRKQVS
jgi:hypothetical protein|tara:strand:- start:1300 stop:1941 length:642 start_codon:yes stop_codon:yes gene_type:complete